MPLRHIMYAYFEYGPNSRYICVKRVPGGFEVLGRTFPKGEAASGALALRLAKFLGAVPKDSGAVPKFAFAMAGTVPRYIIDKFVEVFGIGAIFVGELAEPRSLMENYCRVNPAPHWWPRVGTAPENPEVDGHILETGQLGTAPCEEGQDGEPSNIEDRGGLRPITARLGAGRFAVAVHCDGKGGYVAECGMWSPAKRRVLNADEELSVMKCRFSEANPGATVMQKRIFADVAARHVVYRVCDFKSVGGIMAGSDWIMVFPPDLAASSAARDALSLYGPTRVFLW